MSEAKSYEDTLREVDDQVRKARGACDPAIAVDVHRTHAARIAAHLRGLGASVEVARSFGSGPLICDTVVATWRV